ncbi:MAG: hypothetical protein FP814_08835 [Desulfobacterium sp.]|nr:hypothetical protein [Desulfobacteraceae bacterium]MBA3036583.1 hypothetical protein [Desulfobacterium sp.]MBU4053217.1 hypothetical protein [Pseudomonadota bacterium]
MQALTKKHPTDNAAVELRFLGPSVKRNEAVDALKSLGFVDIMENGKRPIGKEMAKRFGKALNISYKVFL